MPQVIKNPFILVDGSSYLYRAYHTFPLLTNSSGEHTGAIYGMLNMLRSLLKQYHVSHMAVIFDFKGKTFRNELFKQYKSCRLPMPDNLCNQIKPLYKVIKAMGLQLLSVKGVEADDVIGTLALSAEHAGRDVLISTTDKDMAQLVSHKVNLINTMSKSVLGPEEVQLKFGVLPELITDYLALIGDHSDNIPGVPGIGKKTALVLLQKLGGLKLLYQKLDKINMLDFRGSKNIANKLKQYRDIAFLSYQLAKIKTDVKLDVSYDQLIIKEPNIEELILLFKRYEFKRWIIKLETGNWSRRYENVTNTNEDLLKSNYQIIDNMIMLERWIHEITEAGIFAFDIEINKLDKINVNLIGFCFVIKSGKAVYLPVGHDYIGAPFQLNYKLVLAAIQPILENPKIIKIGHNLKLNYGILKTYNIHLSGVVYDTMIESYVLNSMNDHDIDYLAYNFLQKKTITFEEIAGKNPNQLTLNKITLEKAAIYAIKKTDIIFSLHQILWPLINRSTELKNIFEKIEMPLVPVLSRIERNGVLVDKSVLINYSVELTKRLKILEHKAYKIAGKLFNLSSTKQLQSILYVKQKLPVLKKTQHGKLSTDKEVLIKLALNYPLPKLILEYRILSKLKSTYIDKLLKMINKTSNRIHTSYHQAITITGRLSSSNPNLQNIPVRKDEGRKIRKAFIAPPQSCIMTADYSQIELRIIAHCSQDSELLKAFNIGKDIHRNTAADLFNVSLEQVTKIQRQDAKIINFGLIYGMSAFSLSRQLSISKLEAQKYINLYFERYPGVLNYIKKVNKKAVDQGYAVTISGRRFYLSSNRIYNNSNTRKNNSAIMRAAINASIQGSAADIIKSAMIDIDHWLQQKLLPIRMIMQVHDELIFEVNENMIDFAKKQIKFLMEKCFILDVPIKVNIGIGQSWDEVY